MLYAIGEIALVVIGILIALQINNWSQDIQNRKLEKELLAEVHNEFQYNLKEFHGNITVYARARKRLTTIHQNLPVEASNISLDSLASLFGGTDFVGNFDVSMTSIAKLRSTSAFNILSNNELRNLLLKFEVLAADYQQTENEYLDFHNNFYVPVINKYIPFPYHRGITDEKAERNFLNSVEFKNLVRFKRGKVSNLFRTVESTEGMENIVKVMERIIELSDSALNEE